MISPALAGWNLKWLVLAGALALGPITLCRALRFQCLLGLKIPGLFSIFTTTRALNFVFPARLGEAYRIFACRRVTDCSKKRLLGAIVEESVIEVVSFGIISAWAAPAVWSKFPAYIAFGLLTIATFVRPRWITAIALTLGSDLVDALMVGCCLAALGPVRSLREWCAVLVAINIAILIPSPGNIGTLEAGAVLGLSAIGVDRTSALAFALLYRAVQFVPVVGAAAWIGLRSRSGTVTGLIHPSAEPPLGF